MLNKIIYCCFYSYDPLFGEFEYNPTRRFCSVSTE
uniref:Uncharacterized protein n=1 Tax=Rhizophora mucronata TaxID=61149 RepID=A0A2P2MGK3_RHIMU